MATPNRSGPRSAANPQELGPRERSTPQERAWLAGLAWLNSLSRDDIHAALTATGMPTDVLARTKAPAPTIWSLLDPVESDLDAAIRLSELAEWIGKARCFHEAIVAIAAYEPAFAEQLKVSRVAIHEPDWEEESVGLTYLHHTIQERMRAAREAADSARDAALAGRQS